MNGLRRYAVPCLESPRRTRADSGAALSLVTAVDRVCLAIDRGEDDTVVIRFPDGIDAPSRCKNSNFSEVTRGRRDVDGRA